MSEMKSLTLNDKTYDCFVDRVARSQVEATTVVNSASGETIALSDASNYKLLGLHIYGKTTQDGTPTPEAPVDLASVGDGESITVNVTGKNDALAMAVATPIGLAGIPVKSGGNYTDANGQQWICDEVDLARGVYVLRTGLTILTGLENYSDFIASNGTVSAPLSHKPTSLAFCTHAKQDREFNWANDTYVLFRVSYFNVTTLSEFKEFLQKEYTAGNPVTIRYIRATPVEMALSEEELAAYAALHTYRGNTTVTNDASAHMELEYVMDAKKYIDSQISAGILAATVE